MHQSHAQSHAQSLMLPWCSWFSWFSWFHWFIDHGRKLTRQFRCTRAQIKAFQVRGRWHAMRKKNCSLEEYNVQERVQVIYSVTFLHTIEHSETREWESGLRTSIKVYKCGQGSPARGFTCLPHVLLMAVFDHTQELVATSW